MGTSSSKDNFTLNNAFLNFLADAFGESLPEHLIDEAFYSIQSFIIKHTPLENQVIVFPGKRCDSVYFIESGECELYLRDNDNQSTDDDDNLGTCDNASTHENTISDVNPDNSKVVELLESGDYFGELPVLFNTHTSVGVGLRAKRGCVLFSLNHKYLLSFINDLTVKLDEVVPSASKSKEEIVSNNETKFTSDDSTAENADTKFNDERIKDKICRCLNLNLIDWCAKRMFVLVEPIDVAKSILESIIVSTLKKVAFFVKWSETQIRDLLKTESFVDFTVVPKNSIVFDTDNTSEMLYILVKGRADIFVENVHSMTAQAKVFPYTLGEEAFLLNSPSQIVKVKSLQPCLLLAISRISIQKVLNSSKLQNGDHHLNSWENKQKPFINNRQDPNYKSLFKDYGFLIIIENVYRLLRMTSEFVQVSPVVVYQIAQHGKVETASKNQILEKNSCYLILKGKILSKKNKVKTQHTDGELCYTSNFTFTGSKKENETHKENKDVLQTKELSIVVTFKQSEILIFL